MVSAEKRQVSDAGPDQFRRVPYVDLAAQYREERDEIAAIVERVGGHGQFIGGESIELLEAELASYCGTAHAVALGSGTDALILAMEGLGIGPGDEVITPPNSFVASAAAIVRAGATPVFADVLPDQNIDPDQVAAKVTERTKAIMPVHLTGRVARMSEICALAREHGLHVIEDAAQSFGSRLDDQSSGSFGVAGCFSAHPLKNLNAAGDAGFLTTSNGDLADRLRLLRNHGLRGRDVVETWGTVSRLDTLQAELLRMRLGRAPQIIERRRDNAALYRELIASERVFVPPCGPGEFNTFHTFVIQTDNRDALRAYLGERGVQTAVHYPIPIHLQPAARDLGHGQGSFPVAETQAGRILTLPIHQYLGRADIEHVASCINAFYER